jgi:hypothetical protein
MVGIETVINELDEVDSSKEGSEVKSPSGDSVKNPELKTPDSHSDTLAAENKALHKRVLTLEKSLNAIKTGSNTVFENEIELLKQQLEASESRNIQLVSQLEKETLNVMELKKKADGSTNRAEELRTTKQQLDELKGILN